VRSGGTRNHFAADLGLDRKYVVNALDAFTDGVERRVDAARTWCVTRGGGSPTHPAQPLGFGSDRGREANGRAVA
jgi:diacylglycerol kinase family enzyme